MKQLIGNDLNRRSILNNIVRKTLGHLILLSGPFGTGKTEFATQIAKMITCDDISVHGPCGKCEGCSEEIAHGLNNFNARVQLLNMETITYEEMQNLILQSTQKYRNKSEVYIFDEFHLVDEKSQEIWLAETAKLTDCYIIMTTTDKRNVTKGIQSRSIQLSMRSLTPIEAKALIRANFPRATDSIVQAVIRKAGGSPRELINMARFYSNAGLSEEDTVSLITGTGNDEVILCLESLKTRDIFFDSMKTVRAMPDYMIRNSLQDVLWTYLAADPNEKEEMDYLSPFSESQIIKYLNLSNENAQLTLLKMFQQLTVKPAIHEEQLATHTVPKEDNKNASKDNSVQVKRW